MGLLRENQQHDVSQQRRLPTNDINSDVVKSLSESVQLYYYHATTGVYTVDAGQIAGIVVVGTLAQSNILNAAGDVLGTILDTSFAWTTGTILTTQVAFPYDVAELHDTNTGTLKAQAITSGFSNGDFCIDHEAGIIYGVKATAGTSDTGTYKCFSKLTGGGGGVDSDVNITAIAGVDTIADDGAFTAGTSSGITAFGFADETSPDSVAEGDTGALRMTLDRKLHISSNFAEDTAHATGAYGTHILGVRNDSLAALATTDGDYAPFQVTAAGALFTDLSEVLGATLSATNPVFAELTDGTGVISTSNPLTVNISDGTTPIVVDTAFTETLALATAAIPTTGLCYGIDANNGTPILAAMQVAIDNATISATPNVLVTGGAYKAALDTYNDNDASPFHMNADGTLLVTVNGLVGSIAHSGVDAGNPIKIGGIAVDSQIAAVTALDRTNQSFSLYGETISRSHTYGSQSDRAEETDPIDEHYVEEELEDTTNVAGGTLYYPSTTGRAMGNFNNMSMHYVTSGGVTTTIEAKIDDSTDWVDITPAGFELATNATGAASFVDTSGIVDFDDLHVRTIRVKSVTSDATNGVQYHWKLTSL